MAKFDKVSVLNKIGSTGVVPVFYHSNVEVAKHVMKACYEGGTRAFRVYQQRRFCTRSLCRNCKTCNPGMS